MATVDFYCSEHSIPQLTHTIHSPSNTSTALLPCSSQRHHSISSKLTMDPRRLGIFLEQEQRFQPNAYHMHKAVNECERMQLLETVLQIEVRPSIRVVVAVYGNLVFLPLCYCVLILAHLLFVCVHSVHYAPCTGTSTVLYLLVLKATAGGDWLNVEGKGDLENTGS